MAVYKQTSSFCAAGRNMEEWFDSKVSKFPNCGVPDKTAIHLLYCLDPSRFMFFLGQLNGARIMA
eukprot:scaffold21338_cov24-Cyclotella_meneghiniana.AAC.1